MVTDRRYRRSRLGRARTLRVANRDALLNRVAVSRNRRFSFLFAAAAAVFLGTLSPAPSLGQDSSGARAYLVADATTGHILAEKEGNTKLQVASLTKIATAAVVLDWAESGRRGLDTLVTVPAAATAVGGQNPVGFQAGDQVSLRDLLYAALLQSDNIAAETLAYHVGSQIQSGESGGAKTTPTVRFVAQMNALARTLGMERTRFLNPTGADGQEKPFSTAADMARLMRYALGKASFKFFIAQKERKIAIVRAGSNGSQAPAVSAVPPPTAMGPAAAAASGAASPAASPTPPNSIGYLLRNTNELLGVKNVDGGKTGQTSRAGSCLIVTAAREPLVKQTSDTSSEVTQRRLIVVVLGSPDRFRETAALLDRGNALYDAWAATGRPSNGAKDTL